MNFDALLTRISPAQPAGPDLRTVAGATALTEVRELRREDDPAVAGSGAKTADWRGIVRVCTRALEQQSKDLHLAEYLVEALVRTEGFAGLVTGLKVVHGLLDRFWEHVHPGAEAGRIDLELRSAPLQRVGSGRVLLTAVRAVPLTVAMGNGPALAMSQYEESQRVEEAKRVRPAAHAEMVAAGSITEERWQQALAATPAAKRAQTAAAVAEAVQQLDAIAKLSDERFQGGGDAPSYGGLRGLLEQIHVLLQPAASASAPHDDVAAPEASRTAGGEVASSGPVASRQDAIRRLSEVAAYLRAAEPHSPVSHLIERSIRWLNMPFEELMHDLVKTPDVLNGMRETLGLPPAG